MRNTMIRILIFLALSSLGCGRKTLPDATETRPSPPDAGSPVTPAASQPVAGGEPDGLAAGSGKEATVGSTDKSKPEAPPEPERYVTASMELSPPPTQAQKEEVRLGLAAVQVTGRTLGDILEYLARMGNVSLVVLDDELKDMPVTLDVEKTNWRMALDTVARQLDLHVDDTRMSDRFIVISRGREPGEDSPPAKPIPPLPDLTAEEMKTQVSIWVTDRPLGYILDFLAGRGNHTLATPDEGIRKMKVTLRLEGVHWRVVLDVLALKYGLKIDESRADERVLTITRQRP